MKKNTLITSKNRFLPSRSLITHSQFLLTASVSKPLASPVLTLLSQEVNTGDTGTVSVGAFSSRLLGRASGSEEWLVPQIEWHELKYSHSNHPAWRVRSSQTLLSHNSQTSWAMLALPFAETSICDYLCCWLNAAITVPNCAHFSSHPTLMLWWGATDVKLSTRERRGIQLFLVLSYNMSTLKA